VFCLRSSNEDGTDTCNATIVIEIRPALSFTGKRDRESVQKKNWRVHLEKAERQKYRYTAAQVKGHEMRSNILGEIVPGHHDGYQYRTNHLAPPPPYNLQFVLSKCR